MDEFHFVHRNRWVFPMKKTVVLLPFIFLLSSLALAEDSNSERRGGPPDGGRGMRLTEEQRNCMDAQLGGAPHEVKATPDQMQAAASACNVEFSPPPNRGGGKQPPDTDSDS